jgi:hypothetical protein
MGYYNQTSAHNADKILNGTHAFINHFNKGKTKDRKISLANLIDEFNNSPTEKKQKIAGAIFLMGNAAIITNSPYYAGMSETILLHRAYERNFLNSMNNSFKEAIIANTIETYDYSRLANIVKDTLIKLDHLSITSLKRRKLIDKFHDDFVNINPKNKNLIKSFDDGTELYKNFTLQQILAKFTLDTKNINQASSTVGNDTNQDFTI